MGNIKNSGEGASWRGIVLLFTCFAATTSLPAASFRRGDANGDGRVDLSDGISTLGFLFLGSIAPPCQDAADANDSGDLDIADAVFTFSYLFTGGATTPSPGPNKCGPDPTDDPLGCAAYAPAAPDRRCSDDPDSFVISVPSHTIAIQGISFVPTAADLDLTLYDSDGKCLGGRVRESCDWSERFYETGEEYLSALNAGDAGNAEYSWRVDAPSGKPVNYTPSTVLLPYFDGPTCTDFHDSDECEGRPGGVLRLLQFPFPDPYDAWVGVGYRFDSFTNYRWTRRELVMLIRNAIHET